MQNILDTSFRSLVFGTILIRKLERITHRHPKPVKMTIDGHLNADLGSSIEAILSLLKILIMFGKGYAFTRFILDSSSKFATLI